MYEETLSVYAATLAIPKRTGVKRLLCVGEAGTLFCAPGFRVDEAGVIPSEIMPGVKSLG
jgi:putative NADH-flavin reductase